MDKEVVGDLLYIEANKSRAMKDGYYLISVGNRYGYSNGYFHNNKFCGYVGEYKDGVMRDVVTGTLLKYYDDIDCYYKLTDDKKRLYFMYQCPCYVKAKYIGNIKLLDSLNSIEKNSDFFTYSDRICRDISSGSFDKRTLKPNYIDVGKKVFKLKQNNLISVN